MYKIVKKAAIAPKIVLFEVEAPLIANKSEPGHFVMICIDEKGERIPLTIADYDKEKGTITLVIQEVGLSTHEICLLEEGDYIKDVVGPLGEPIEITKVGTIACVSGGVGVAPMYPKARALAEAGNRILSYVGARSKAELFFKEEMEKISDVIKYSTDDGSLGHHGFVTDLLKEALDAEKIDEVIAIGPLPMMKAACDVTRDYEVKTIVSLNAIMVDGTGMCGSCRVTLDGETKFSCVDGPAFDGHKIDFEELIDRNCRFTEEEQKAYKLAHKEGGHCKCQSK